ncbi:hypothetical protein L484_026315 [Morus notabilis]|uniref:Malectin-like domain-containing protein n=1 Tax=Morus notabilis TaxID=981085 RepID=W9RV61_9ROSA|nr:hypothetical protein L484_026315 [Morus notabilis]
MANLSKHFFFAILQRALVILTVLVQAQGKSDNFISIDCGILDGSNYTDETTGIGYLSDSNFTETGESHEISPGYKLQTAIQQFWNVRSFPEGIRNCYILKPVQGKDTRYLIRSRFLYGNYDNKAYLPVFDLYLGVHLWDTVNLEFAGTPVDMEIIHVPSSNYIYVCLVNTGYGVPFISALELRPLDSQIYRSQSGSALQLFKRYDFGTTSNEATRYQDDVYDRLWSPFSKDTTWTALNNSLADKNSLGKTIFQPPLEVLNTAYTPSGTSNSSGNNMGFNWKPPNRTSPYYFYMHFAELQEINNNESREFNIYINGDLLPPGYIPLDQYYLRIVSVYTAISDPIITPDSEGVIQVWINQTENSTLPPLINAMEIFMLKELSQRGTNENDVNATLNIKSEYGVKKNWQGDPCVPKAYLWDGLDCSYDANNLPRIISLDLSNNSLDGKVPEFLAQLKYLRTLNLQGNNLTGPIPDALLQRSKNGLSLRSALTPELIDTYLNPCLSGSCGKKKKKKKKKYIIPVVASVSGSVILFTLLIWCLRSWRRKRKGPQTKLIWVLLENRGQNSIFRPNGVKSRVHRRPVTEQCITTGRPAVCNPVDR